eukprot:CAMPEP_0203666938 /NCGR_PEP_ID=MMETSP0090-20130426/3866_1 /ASSEMBLY_ACC=CAM_ASM_001088 /TAXON_ID=426623 /ORGANISM="Chaetoceros affinis, Strain CCMP159" /LENGTH=396 /DNA_ID=CAMNT_0050530951 /DNA_START=103 /DNA_END=1293 /DNA_ORIENTATION=+
MTMIPKKQLQLRLQLPAISLLFIAYILTGLVTGTSTSAAFLLPPRLLHTSSSSNSNTYSHHHHDHRQRQRQRQRRRPTTFLNDKKPKKEGYQFGDITKSLINKVTNKDKYEFGDLSKHLDSKVKERIAKLNDKNEYEFGDLTKYLVRDFTTNSNYNSNSTTSSSSEYKYKFGDITKEIIRRVKSRDYTMEDLAILIKVLVSFGVGLSPVASFLPVKLLVDLLNYSIAGDLGTRVTSAISLELDRRMKKAITGNEDYKLGDATKGAILKYTGRDEYTFGDITKTVVESVNEYDRQQKKIAELNEKIKNGGSTSTTTTTSGGTNSSESGLVSDGVTAAAIASAVAAAEGNGADDKDKGQVQVEVIKKPVFLSDDENFDKIAKELKEWDDKFLKILNKE